MEVPIEIMYTPPNKVLEIGFSQVPASSACLCVLTASECLFLALVQKISDYFCI